MKVIITGTTGMVGEGVLLECLASGGGAGDRSRTPLVWPHPSETE